MDKTNLKKRGHSWYARLVVPPSLRAAVGKSEFVRALNTRDLKEANRRKHKVLAQLHEEMASLATQATLPKDAAEYVLAAAKELRAAVLAGEATDSEAETALDQTLEAYLERAARKHGVDEHGHPLIAEAHERTLKLANRVLHSGDVSLLSEAIKAYLAETAKRIQKKTLAEKDKELHGFAGWLGADCEVGTITKRIAGRYTTEVLLKRSSEPSTVRKGLSHMMSFWTWMSGRGLAEDNPWAGISGSVKGNTRGTKAKRRPWTDSELKKLIEGIPEGDPLLPMVLLAAYGGLRREEIALLRVEDVAEDDALVITEGKTRAALRRVPIHPAIKGVVAALVQDSTDGYLIPGLLTGGADSKRSHYVGKRFTTLRRGLGLSDPSLNFHTLRNSFTQRLEDSEVPESTAKLIIGHSREGEITYGRYSPGPRFEVIRQAVLKVAYGKVDEIAAKLAPKIEVRKKSNRRRNASELLS